MTLRLVPTPLEVADSAARPARGRRGPVAARRLRSVGRRGTRRWQRLRQPGALAVTSGQQPGLFTGPLYTVHKALSTAALARVLERQWNRPVVPIFWVAGDDHDFAEASQAAWIRADGALATASLPPRPPDAPLTPMYRQPLGEAVVRRARGAPGATCRLPSSATSPSNGSGAITGPRPRSAARSPARWPSCSRPPASWCSTAPIRRPSARPPRSSCGRWSRPPRSIRISTATPESLGEAARHSGVTLGDGAALVMLEGGPGPGSAGGGRRRLRDPARQGAVRPRDAPPDRRQRAGAALAQRAAPAGGGERGAAYRRLSRRAGRAALPGSTPRRCTQRLGVERQLPLPRWSGVMVEPRVDRVLEKFGVDARRAARARPARSRPGWSAPSCRRR